MLSNGASRGKAGTNRAVTCIPRRVGERGTVLSNRVCHKNGRRVRCYRVRHNMAV